MMHNEVVALRTQVSLASCLVGAASGDHCTLTDALMGVSAWL